MNGVAITFVLEFVKEPYVLKRNYSKSKSTAIFWSFTGSLLSIIHFGLLIWFKVLIWFNILHSPDIPCENLLREVLVNVISARKLFLIALTSAAKWCSYKQGTLFRKFIGKSLRQNLVSTSWLIGVEKGHCLPFSSEVQIFSWKVLELRGYRGTVLLLKLEVHFLIMRVSQNMSKLWNWFIIALKAIPDLGFP